MSKASSSLLQSLQAFFGDRAEGLAIVAGAIRAAVLTYAAHGTDAPIIAALLFVGAVKGEGVRARAVRAGIAAAGLGLTRGAKPRATFAGCAAGKGGEQSAALADAAEGALLLAAAEVLSMPSAPKKMDATAVAARALKTLDSLSDAQLMRAWASNAGRDLEARLQRVVAEAAARAAAAAADEAVVRAARKVEPIRSEEMLQAA